MEASALQVLVISLLNIGLAGMAGAGLAIAWLQTAGSGWALEPSRRAARLLTGSIVLSILATLLALWCQAASMADEPLAEAGPAILLVLRDTHYGHAWLAGIALLACAAFIHSRDAAPSRRRSMVLLTVLAGFAATRSAASHAGAAGFGWPMIVDWVHLMAVSLWAGGVFAAVCAVFIRPQTTEPDPGAVMRCVNTLSRTATWALAVVVMTGLVNSWRGLDGSAQALVTSSYGTVLIIKLVLVLAAVALGGFNRWVVMPSLQSAQGFQGSLPKFIAILRIESLVLLAVLVAAAVLSTSEPAVVAS